MDQFLLLFAGFVAFQVVLDVFSRSSNWSLLPWKNTINEPSWVGFIIDLDTAVARRARCQHRYLPQMLAFFLCQVLVGSDQYTILLGNVRHRGRLPLSHVI